jgi:S1/P1 Nuclease
MTTSGLMKKAACSLLLSINLLVMLPVCAGAWGTTGHRITARIAAQYLNPLARQRVIELLRADIDNNRNYYQQNCPDVLPLSVKKKPTPQDTDQLLLAGLACVAPWPDPPVKNQRPYTSNWHFVDIPVVRPAGGDPIRFKYDAARDCATDEARGDCSIQAIERLRPILGNAKIPAQKDHEYGEETATRAEALKFIVHIIGDMHQPLHCITDKKNTDAVANPKDLGDLGGNTKIATWFGETHTPYGLMNLHSIWDDGIIAHTMQTANLNEEQYFQKLLSGLPAQGSPELAALQAGDIFAWTDESYDFGVKNAYGTLPQIDLNCEYEDKNGGKHKGCYRLDAAYYMANKDVVEQRLQRGGVRLARVLNDILGK